jgi:hypothetical protein
MNAVSLPRGGFLCETGRRELSPRAMTNREHPDRLPPLIDFINDSINVRLFAVKQVQQLSLNRPSFWGNRAAIRKLC